MMNVFKFIVLFMLLLKVQNWPVHTCANGTTWKVQYDDEIKFIFHVK